VLAVGMHALGEQTKKKAARGRPPEWDECA
jgi:hypothetical protein